MMSNAMLMTLTRQRVRNDRTSSELRSYARQEWNADTPWVHAALPRLSVPDRIRRWARGRSRTGRSQARSDGERSTTTTKAPAVPRISMRDCPHVCLEEIGFAGSAEFLRCASCGQVLVAQAGRQWSLVAEPAPLSDAALDA